MKIVPVAVLLSLLSLGLPAPLTDCDTMLKPKNITNGEMLGQWHWIGGTSDDITTHSFIEDVDHVLWQLNVTSQSNVLKLFQTGRFGLGVCEDSTFGVIFENGTVFTDPPYLKELSLLKNCTDCLVGKEVATSEGYVITNLHIFSRSRRVSGTTIKILQKYARCLGMLPLIEYSPESELCPVPAPSS